MSSNPMRPILLLIALVAAFAMAPVQPEAGNVLFLLSGGLSILLLRSVDLSTLARPVVFMPLAGLVLLAVTYGFGDGSINGVTGIIYFAPLLAVGPLLALDRGGLTVPPQTIAILALCGVSGAAVVAVVDFFSSGMARAGTSVANPIHFADLALAVGFISTLGIVYVQGKLRYIYLAGPFMALTAVLLSGTRGAIVAAALMAATAAGLIIWFRLVSLRFVGATALAGSVIVIVAIVAGVSHTSGLQRVSADISDVLKSGVPGDHSTALRLQMYLGAFRAFIASPLVGYGPFDYIVAASNHADVPFDMPHLHNDLADFATSGGVPGVIAYFLFLLTPVVEAFRAPPSTTRTGVIVVATSLCAGYFIMGLTNAMFGILNITVCFAAVALVIALISQQRDLQ